MPRDPAGNITGTTLHDTLWGTAIQLDDGTYVNNDDRGLSGALFGYEGYDRMYGDIYFNDTTPGGNDFLYGGPGSDLMYGDAYDPWAHIEGMTDRIGGSDTLFGGLGDDDIYGQGGDDLIYGEAGNDSLVGGYGSDTIYGGAGHDKIWLDLRFGKVDHRLNIAYGDAGNDQIGGARWGANRLYGGADNDRLSAGIYNDTLEGGSGRDVLDSGSGNDLLNGASSGSIVGDLTDTLYGGAGDDTLIGGDGNDALYGGSGQDVLWNDQGNDILDGGAGADLLMGGVGNDIYHVDDAGDRFVNPDPGIDQVVSSIDYTLGSQQEHLILTGLDSLTASGNAAANVLTGNNGRNTLLGFGGNDFLNGLRGDDTMRGGTGADTMQGGLGADCFVFDAPSASTVAAVWRDTITDFTPTQGDFIDLRGMDANAALAGDQAFRFIGAHAFSGQAGQLRYAEANGKVMVSGDVNGDRVADFAVLLDDPLTLTIDCFLL